MGYNANCKGSKEHYEKNTLVKIVIIIYNDAVTLYSIKVFFGKVGEEDERNIKIDGISGKHQSGRCDVKRWRSGK